MRSRVLGRTRHRGDALLRAAEDVFADRCFEAATMRDIAAATGVTKTVVYRHFPSKEDLFCSVVEHAAVRLEAAMDAMLSVPAPPDVMLSRAVRVWFDYVAGHEAAFKLVARRQPGAEAALGLADEVRDRIVHRIAKAFDARTVRIPPRSVASGSSRAWCGRSWGGPVPRGDRRLVGRDEALPHRGGLADGDEPALAGPGASHAR